MSIQYGDEKLYRFSETTDSIRPLNEQVVCYLTYTTPETHEIIKNNLKNYTLKPPSPDNIDLEDEEFEVVAYNLIIISFSLSSV